MNANSDEIQERASGMMIVSLPTIFFVLHISRLSLKHLSSYLVSYLLINSIISIKSFAYSIHIGSLNLESVHF